MAGFESTAHSVAWALYEIARHPKVQQKLADELAGAGLLWQPGGGRREGGWAALLCCTFGEFAWQAGRCVCLSLLRDALPPHTFEQKMQPKQVAHRRPCAHGSLQASPAGS